ncbi:MAG: hypothetical protein EAY69_01810 [Cytophagales bacterium]|nr:MAG: hypothetical protein EAY69_01810 [Cytophagales bacterium]
MSISSSISFGQCASGNFYTKAELFTVEGVPVTYVNGNTKYYLKLTISPTGGSTVLSVLQSADGIGYIPYINAPLTYIPAPIGKDMSGSTTEVTYSVTTVPEEDLSTFIYINVRFACTSCCPRPQGTSKQFTILTGR